MKILHVLPSIDPKFGGTVESARHMTASMSRLGVTSEVLCLEAPQPKVLRDWAVEVRSLNGTVSYYQYSSELVPWLRQNHARYDAVLVHGVWRHPSVGVWRALRHQETPYFIFTHGMLDPWFAEAYPLKHIKKTLFWLLFERRVLRDARSVLFTCESEKLLARRSFQPFQCREQVVGMGTAEPPADVDAQLTQLLELHPHLRGQRIILFLSRLHPKKGCDLLIRAFARIAPADSRLHLLMVGPDEVGWISELKRIAAEEKIGERITWAGQLDGALKWQAFRAAEVFALPSHSENYGHAVAESMACGVPVLISDKVNIWREIVGDAAGLVATDNLAGTLDLLNRWCALDAEGRRGIAMNARRCYCDRFNDDTFARRLLDFLRDNVGASAMVPA